MMKTKPSKQFVKEMEKMYPQGATISPKKKTTSLPMRGQRTATNMSKKKPK